MADPRMRHLTPHLLPWFARGALARALGLCALCALCACAPLPYTPSVTLQQERIADKAGDGTTVDVTSYASCANGTEVRGYVVNGGGHAWPGGLQYFPASIIGKTSKNMDASETIWEFFSRHTLASKANVGGVTRN